MTLTPTPPFLYAFGAGMPENFWLAYRGSIAHDMFVPSTDPKSIDDIDLMGFCFGTKANYFGLTEWASRGTREIKEGPYDMVLYEIRKAFSLLLQGNPNIMSMLWVAPQFVLKSSPASERIVASKHLFRGKHVYNAFSGYAHQQMEKMETRDPAELRLYLAVTAEMKFRGIHPNERGALGDAPDRSSGEARDVRMWTDDKLRAAMAGYHKKGENIGYMGDKRKQLVLEHGYDSKNAAHLIRLLRMSVEFFKTGEMVVTRTSDRDELLAIKRGQVSLADVKVMAVDLFEQARLAKESSSLPDHPDREGADRLLVELVSNHLM